MVEENSVNFHKEEFRYLLEKCVDFCEEKNLDVEFNVKPYKQTL